MRDLSSSDSEEKSLLKFIEHIEELFVPELKNGFDRPFEGSDFASYIVTCDHKFKFVGEFSANEIYSLTPQWLNKFKKNCLSSVIILRGQHTAPNKWTTDYSIQISGNILNNILRIYGYSTVEEALSSDNCTLFKHVLNKMRPWLLKDSWKNYPAAIVCYFWVLCNLKSPYLSDHLNIILPPALIYTDDFVLEYRIFGLKSLRHIINNVTMTSLCWYGQDKVILKALEPIFYEKDANLIILLVEVFVLLLSHKYSLTSDLTQWTEFDDMIDRFINNMMGEQKLNLRSAYIKSLSKIIQARRVGILLHSSSLMNVFTDYVLEPTSSLEALYVLEVFIDSCWPRISKHTEGILLLISKCLLGLQARGYPSECQSHVKNIFSKLKKISPNKIEEFLVDLHKEESLKELQIIFKSNSTDISF